MGDYQLQRRQAWDRFQWHMSPSGAIPHSAWAHASPRKWLSWMLSNDRRTHREIIFPLRQDDLLAGVIVMIAPVNERGEPPFKQPQRGVQRSVYDAAARSPRYTFADIIGCSPTLVHVREAARQAAQRGASALLVGEPGTGKTLLAHAMHAASARQAHPFVLTDCAAVPPEQLEAELFGGGPGQASRFEQAQEGTLFLKTLDAMPLDLQSKLFRVLQERQLLRAGTGPIPVTCAVMASVERDLAGLVAQGRFRRDLWYRMGVVQLDVPPLRERPADIPLLIEHYWEGKRQELGRQVHLSTAALRILEMYPWPGNVRELVVVVEQIFTAHRKLVIEPKDLPGSVLTGAERCALERALQQAQGNRTRAARLIGMSRTSLYRKLKAFGLPLKNETQRSPNANAKPAGRSQDL